MDVANICSSRYMFLLAGFQLIKIKRFRIEGFGYQLWCNMNRRSSSGHCVDRQSISNATGSEQGMVLNHGP